MSGIRFVKNTIEHGLRSAITKAEKISEASLEEFAAEVLLESMDEVPFDTGELESSVINEPVTMKGRKATKIIGYDTPYAAIQHENLGFWHPGDNSMSPIRGASGKAKYLEDPINNLKGSLTKVIMSKSNEEF